MPNLPTTTTSPSIGSVVAAVNAQQTATKQAAVPAQEPEIETTEEPEADLATEAAPDGEAPELDATAAGEPAHDAVADAAAAKKGIEMTSEALAKRLAREREAVQRQMLKELGIDDVAAWKAAQQKQQAELKKFQAEQEKRRRAAMSDTEKLTADLQTRNARIQELEAELGQMRAAAESADQERQVHSIIGKSAIDPSMAPAAMLMFKAHVNDLTKRDPGALDAFTDETILEFFENLAKENPKFARSAGDKAAPIRKPLSGNTGKVPARPAQGGTNDKTARPGQKNSMSQQEVREFAKKNYGINY